MEDEMRLDLYVKYLLQNTKNINAVQSVLLEMVGFHFGEHMGIHMITITY